MEIANHLILIGSCLILLSILAGTLSSRFGVPLLLVFLILGMLAGEDGPGGIDFDDYETTYLVGSVALAIILFDGGLRTRWHEFRNVGLAAAVLATLGVVATAAVTGVAARYLLSTGWLEGFLIGSIVASTDAAAVFLLLGSGGMRLREKLRSVLEAEAGLNDPMAVLLTVTFVGLITSADAALAIDTTSIALARFVLQIVAGIALGFVGGHVLLAALNGLNIASGLYPVLASAGALLLFAGTQEVGASGFLAVYIAGLVIGNRRHKATQLIDRFHDGLAWLCQIVMFLILGLLVTPSSLLPIILPALGIAGVLIFVARPIAIALSLLPFRFGKREIGFVSWVGLRGAVPIFLGTIPVLSGVDKASTYFGVVFVIVMASLLVQGSTIGLVGGRLGVLLAPRAARAPGVEIDLPSDIGRTMAAYNVQPNSMALRRKVARLPLPEGISMLSIIRDGALRTPADVDRLAPGDDVLLLSPPDQMVALDRLFGARRSGGPDLDILGEFSFEGTTPIGAIADAYGFWVPERTRGMEAARFLRRHLWRRPTVGRRLHLGAVELIVGAMADDRISKVNIELDPPAPGPWRRLDRARIWLRSLFSRRI